MARRYFLFFFAGIFILFDFTVYISVPILSLLRVVFRYFLFQLSFFFLSNIFLRLNRPCLFMMFKINKSNYKTISQNQTGIISSYPMSPNKYPLHLVPQLLPDQLRVLGQRLVNLLDNARRSVRAHLREPAHVARVESQRNHRVAAAALALVDHARNGIVAGGVQLEELVTECGDQ